MLATVITTMVLIQPVAWAQNTPAQNALDNPSLQNSKEQQAPASSVLLKPANQSPPPIQLSVNQDVLRLSLQKVVELVVQQNLDVAIAKARIGQAKGKWIQSIGTLLPSVSGNLLFENYDGGQIFVQEQPVAVRRNTVYPKLVFDYPVQLGGRDIFRMLGARNQVNQAKTIRDSVLQSQMKDALVLYFTWLKDSSALSAAQQSLEEANSNLQYNLSRFKAGFATKFEVMQSKAQQAERKNDVLKAENNEQITRVRLASLLNIPPGLNFVRDSDEIHPIQLAEDNVTINQCLSEAEKNRPDLKDLLYQIKEAKNNVRASYANLLPTVRLGSYYGGVGPQFNDLREVRQAGVQINVDMFRNMGVTSLGEIKTSHGLLQEALLKKEKQLNDIRAGITESFYNTQFYREQTQVNAEKLKASQEAHRIALSRLKNGVGINLDVVQLQTDLAKARLDYQTSILNYNAAQLKLLFESGSLTPEHVLARAEQGILPAEMLNLIDEPATTAEPTK